MILASELRHMVIFALIALLSHGLLAQSQDDWGEIDIDRSEQAHPYSHLRVNNDPGNFQFAIVSDRTGGHRPGIFEDAIRKLNLLQPEFVMSVGDLIEGYTTNEEQIHREWDEFDGLISGLEMPFFYMPGNHDYINDVMARIWKEKFGPSYYHFVYRDVLFLCLNSEEALKGSGQGGIEEPQFEYFKKALEENPDVKWTLVFMHQPLWLSQNAGYWEDLEGLLKNRKYTVFAGHNHHYVKYMRNDSKYFMLATTGGISALRGPNYGEFDHMVWITMTEDGPIIANLLLDGIWNEDVVKEDLIKMIARDRIRIQPVFFDDHFSEAEFQIKITNDDNYPMLTGLAFEPHRQLYPEIVEFQKEVPPNSVETLNIPIRAFQKGRTDEFDAIQLYSIFAYRYEDRREVKLDARYRLAPIKRIFMDYAPVKVNVDGILEEWTRFPFRNDIHSEISDFRDEYQGDYDASYEFNLMYDEDYLYLGLSVWDDEVTVNRKSALQEQDGVIIHLDARSVDISANGKGSDRYEDFISMNFAPSLEKRNDPQLYQPDRLPNGTLVKTSKTIQGFDAEIAIPMEHIRSWGGENWESVRLNIAYLDKDGESLRSGLWWRPEWSSNQNYIGSGTVFRKK